MEGCRTEDEGSFGNGFLSEVKGSLYEDVDEPFEYDDTEITLGNPVIDGISPLFEVDYTQAGAGGGIGIGRRRAEEQLLMRRKGKSLDAGEGVPTGRGENSSGRDRGAAMVMGIESGKRERGYGGEGKGRRRGGRGWWGVAGWVKDRLLSALRGTQNYTLLNSNAFGGRHPPSRSSTRAWTWRRLPCCLSLTFFFFLLIGISNVITSVYFYDHHWSSPTKETSAAKIWDREFPGLDMNPFWSRGYYNIIQESFPHVPKYYFNADCSPAAALLPWPLSYLTSALCILNIPWFDEAFVPEGDVLTLRRIVQTEYHVWAGTLRSYYTSFYHGTRGDRKSNEIGRGDGEELVLGAREGRGAPSGIPRPGWARVWIRLGDLPRFASSGGLLDLLEAQGRPFTLISTDGDHSIPSYLSPTTETRILSSPHLRLWLTQNLDKNLSSHQCTRGSPPVKKYRIGKGQSEQEEELKKRAAEEDEEGVRTVEKKKTEKENKGDATIGSGGEEHDGVRAVCAKGSHYRKLRPMPIGLDFHSKKRSLFPEYGKKRTTKVSENYDEDSQNNHRLSSRDEGQPEEEEVGEGESAAMQQWRSLLEIRVKAVPWEDRIPWPPFVDHMTGKVIVHGPIHISKTSVKSLQFHHSNTANKKQLRLFLFAPLRPSSSSSSSS